MKEINQYAEMKAGDAFLAGHLGDWVRGHKNQLTKNQYAHLVCLLERYSFDMYEEKQEPDKMMRYLNLIFDDIK